MNKENLNKFSCSTCKFWQRDNEDSEEMGLCSFLSGKNTDIYPDSKVTGVESLPICEHDGMGFTYETKSWFGCIHHENC